MNTFISYQQVMDHFKTPGNLASRLGCTPQAIYLWKGVVPKARQFELRWLIAEDVAAGRTYARPAA